jgi:GPI-anchor transamidase subunit T
MLFFIFFAFFTVCKANVEHDKYDEILRFTPLPDGRIITTFQFNISTDTSDIKNNEYNLFPKSFGQILATTNVKTLSLILTKGSWDRNNFGDLEPSFIGPPGAELRATFFNKTLTQSKSEIVVDKREKWKQLKAALGGIFCASLSTIDKTTTITGTRYVYPDQFYGMLQREMLCTENLVPLIKLLPCRSNAGLATLLAPTTVFQADFTSIGVNVQVDANGRLIMSMNTILILNHAENVLIHNRQESIPCPCATSSTIQVNKPKWAEIQVASIIATKQMNGESDNISKIITVSREPDQISCNSNCYLYDAFKNMSLSVMHGIPRDWQQLLIPALMVKNPLIVQRSLAGTGRVKGGLVTKITNIGGNDVEIKYLDILPWYLQVYSHTLIVKLNDRIIANGAWRLWPLKNVNRNKRHPHIFVTPASREGPPSKIECLLTLKPGDSFSVEIQYLLMFLQFEKFPPDANRGFDIPSAVIQVRQVESGNREGGDETKHWNTVYTSGLMIEMPYPDFSMPYNVVTLTSTLMAFIGGTILNMLRRRELETTES